MHIDPPTHTMLDPSNVAGLGGLSGSSSAMSSTASFFSMDYDQDINDNRNGISPDDMDVDEDKPDDLLDQLNGMFRLLDLIGEQGSGGIGKYHYYWFE